MKHNAGEEALRIIDSEKTEKKDGSDGQFQAIGTVPGAQISCP